MTVPHSRESTHRATAQAATGSEQVQLAGARDGVVPGGDGELAVDRAGVCVLTVLIEIESSLAIARWDLGVRSSCRTASSVSVSAVESGSRRRRRESEIRRKSSSFLLA